MKLNNKGWGTLEMFLLSGGLLIALLVSVYFISQLYGSFDNAVGYRQYEDMEARLASAAKQYVIENNIANNDTLTINYDTLEALGYIDSLKDNEGYPCTGYVVISKIDFTNSYKAYIVCRNYKTTDLLD